MHVLNRSERTALERLPNDTARMVIQRWLEITGADTHSEWRWRARPSDNIDCSDDLIAAIKSNMREKAYDLVAPMATRILMNRGPRIWQHAAMSSFVLDRDDKHTGRDFFDRLGEFLDPITSQPVDYAHVSWLISPCLSNRTRLPVDADPSVQLDAEWPLISVRGSKKNNGERSISLAIKVVDTPSEVNRAAVQLRTYGSVILDLFRVAVPDQKFTTSAGMTTTSATVSTVETPILPRLNRHRMRPLSRYYLTRTASSRLTKQDRESISALRWVATANVHWPESPATAAAMLWPAIEILFGKCVYEHSRSCMDGCQLAMDKYLSRLPGQLILELNTYLKTLWDVRKRRDSGHAIPPPWLTSSDLDAPKNDLKWLDRIFDKMKKDISSDPLLCYRVSNLRAILRGKNSFDQAGYKTDLRELYMARNNLVHEGQSRLDEARSEYLAALAIDIILTELEARVPSSNDRKQVER